MVTDTHTVESGERPTTESILQCKSTILLVSPATPSSHYSSQQFQLPLKVPPFQLHWCLILPAYLIHLISFPCISYVHPASRHRSLLTPRSTFPLVLKPLVVFGANAHLFLHPHSPCLSSYLPILGTRFWSLLFTCFSTSSLGRDSLGHWTGEVSSLSVLINVLVFQFSVQLLRLSGKPSLTAPGPGGRTHSPSAATRAFLYPSAPQPGSGLCWIVIQMLADGWDGLVLISVFADSSFFPWFSAPFFCFVFTHLYP